MLTIHDFHFIVFQVSVYVFKQVCKTVSKTLKNILCYMDKDDIDDNHFLKRDKKNVSINEVTTNMLPVFKSYKSLCFLIVI